MPSKKFTQPMKILITRLFTPFPSKTVQRMVSKVELGKGEVRKVGDIEADLIRILADAKASGIVVEVSQTHGHKPAMGNYHDHITLRESREVVMMIMARRDPKPEEK